MSFEYTGGERVHRTEADPLEQSSADITERSFLREIDRLNEQKAGQIAARWMSEYENLHDSELSDFFTRFKGFLQQRERALFSLEIPSGLDERLAEEMRQFDKDVTLSFGSAELFQGNGATARAYEVIGHPHICVKFITDQARYNENNHIRVEFNLLNMVRGVRSGEVRTPTPYFLRIHPSEGHSYGMEKVEGKSLSQIIERPDAFPELVALAKTLDRDKLREDLLGFVRAMHTEKGVTHNDLFERNIMLDREGNLFVIDFGKGRRHEIDNLVRRQEEESDITIANSSIRSFFQKIDNINI